MDIFHNLFKRDECTDAIPGTISETCTPGNTLCCVPSLNTGASTTFPQCQSIGGRGACCSSDTDCYIETPSNCEAAGAVQCTLLAEGTTEACCPSGTICPDNFNQSTQFEVKCNLVFNSTTSISSSISPSVSTSISSPTSASTTSKSSPVEASSFSSIANTATISNNNGNPKGLSGGADAGIGVAAAIAVLALFGLGFWLYRRGRKRGMERARPPQQDSYPAGYRMSNPAVVGEYYAPIDNTRYSKQHELPGEQMQLVELDGSHPQANN